MRKRNGVGDSCARCGCFFMLRGGSLATSARLGRRGGPTGRWDGMGRWLCWNDLFVLLPTFHPPPGAEELTVVHGHGQGVTFDFQLDVLGVFELG
ncbi:hypothetical protein GUJ93_ZPchr0006g45091 [Zizania palustris]|uniref:Uncharacterized protein n=1 Tax=Zizania palustris TaxID=103762 RepID=A0A8J5VKK6_ZIZPA|nr:hypothetical protein GUJ93_ZPchr0006g45091 [Zizania palustris]